MNATFETLLSAMVDSYKYSVNMLGVWPHLLKYEHLRVAHMMGHLTYVWHQLQEVPMYLFTHIMRNASHFEFEFTLTLIQQMVSYEY